MLARFRPTSGEWRYMKFKIVKNFQGENRANHARQIEVVEPISGEEMIGYSTFDPRLFWQFFRAIKRRHPDLFKQNTTDPSKFLTVGLVSRQYFEEGPSAMLIAHLNGEMFALAPVVSTAYEPVFPDPVAPPRSEQKYEEWANLERYTALRDYHVYLTDAAEQYRAQAEERKNDTDSSSVKMMMELRHMHAVYTSMADGLMQYINSLIN